MNQDRENTIDLKSIKIGRKKVEVNEELKFSNETKVEQPSFVKEEHPEINIPGEIRPLNSASKTKQFYLVIIISLLSTLLLGFGIYYFYNSNNYYVGEWKVELSDQEKSAGLKSMNYNINDNVINQTIESETNSILITAEINFNVNVTAKRSAQIEVLIKDIVLNNIDVKIPEQLCAQNPAQCDQIRKSYSDSINESIQKQKAMFKDKYIRLSPSKDSLRLIMPDNQEEKLKK